MNLWVLTESSFKSNYAYFQYVSKKYREYIYVHMLQAILYPTVVGVETFVC